MLPRLTNDDFVVTSTMFRKLEVGDLVVAKHPQYGDLIKRVAVANHKKDNFVLVSDNPKGLSSEQMGGFSRDDIASKVLMTIPFKREF